ncbi:MAG: AzlD domain-containing protein [Chloroflexi bacterium]|nr:AzlD domain-containing protein [Chloroflexota bacterium]
MSWELLIGLAVLTYVSRAAALTFLPAMPPPIGRVLDRMPPALFAGLAMQGILSPASGLAPLPVLVAATAALLVAPRRSLLLCLIFGLLGFGVASLLS